MNRRVNLLTLWLSATTVIASTVNLILADVGKERLAWTVAAFGGVVGCSLCKVIHHLQELVLLQREQVQLWQRQARRSGAEAFRLSMTKSDPDG